MIVTALIVPFVIGILLMLFRGDVPGRLAALLGAAAMGTSLVLFALVWDGPGWGGVSGEVDTSWIKPLNAHFHVGVTSLSWPFLLMTAFLGLLCCIWLVADDTSPAVVGLVLVISASSLGVFASLDLLLFFVFFELALIPMWFLIAWWGETMTVPCIAFGRVDPPAATALARSGADFIAPEPEVWKRVDPAAELAKLQAAIRAG